MSDLRFTRVCSTCKERKEIDQFHVAHSYCKLCSAASSRKHYAKHREDVKAQMNAKYKRDPAKYREKAKLRWQTDPTIKLRHRLRHYKRTFGITLSLQEFFHLQDLQQGRCGICQAKTEDLEIDHCHVENVVRGLLCINCNVLLGQAKDSIDTLNRAVNYLRRSKMSILDVDLDEFPDSDVIPSAQYKVRIDKVDGPLIDKNDEQYLKFAYTVVEGPYTNRMLFDNYVSLSPQAARASQLKKILKACAFPGSKLRTTDELIGLEMVVVVTIKEDPQYGEQNKINVYLDLAGASDMSAAGPLAKRLKK